MEMMLVLVYLVAPWVVLALILEGSHWLMRRFK